MPRAWAVDILRQTAVVAGGRWRDLYSPKALIPQFPHRLPCCKQFGKKALEMLYHFFLNYGD